MRHVLAFYVGMFFVLMLVNRVLSNVSDDIQDFDPLDDDDDEPHQMMEDVDPEEAARIKQQKKEEQERIQRERDTVSADVIKAKYGVDMGSIFGKNMRFSKDAAEGLISHATSVQSSSLKAKKDFKFYNNSYLYVSFRKEVLEKEAASKLAVKLIKSTKQQLQELFWNESAEYNNNTRYELLRKLKREIEKNETEKNPRAKDPKNVPEPDMDLEEQLKFAE